MERIEFPGHPADARDTAVIAAQIGRRARGDVAVAVRCEFGLPAVVRTSPRLEDGSPFPTLFHLACPVAVRAIGRLEAAGTMGAYQLRLASDEQLRAAYGDAHRRYIARRDSIEVTANSVSAGGMPERVKCLHALYAHELADGNPIGAMAREEIEPLECPGPCVVDDEDGLPSRAPGHPGFAGKKRRR
ncbi:MAG: DUF501 domain-containing protein [Actinomycetota bacterium]